MTRQIISPNRVALFLDSPELADLGIAAEDPDSGILHTLVIDEFQRSGLSPQGGIEIEVFFGNDSLMVFAEFGTPLLTEIFAFSDFEDLLAAIESLAGTPGFSKLTCYEGRYFLELCDAKSRLQKIAANVSEFGVSVPPEKSAFFSEHGDVLLSPNAVGELCRAFFGRVP